MNNEEKDSDTRLKELNEKIDKVYESVEKTRKYFLTIIWISVILFVIPLIGMIFVVPSFLDTYLGSLDGLL